LLLNQVHICRANETGRPLISTRGANLPLALYTRTIGRCPVYFCA
jgi:hypothetical protein